MRRREELSTPRPTRGIDLHYDPEVFARFAESFARFLGTGRYLAIQTVLVIVWILINVFAISLQWDPYPFILLNLAFSTQAAYAAPLILLAQNRQADRDRVESDRDRDFTQRMKADTEYLTRELASIRLALADIPTIDDLEELKERIEELLEKRKGKKKKGGLVPAEALETRADELSAAADSGANGGVRGDGDLVIDQPVPEVDDPRASA